MKKLSDSTLFSAAIKQFVISGSRGETSQRTGRDYGYNLKDFQNWLFDRMIAESSVPDKKPKLKKLSQFRSPETLKIHHITARHVKKYLDQALRQGKSPATVNTKLYTLKSFYKFLAKASCGKITDIAGGIPRFSQKSPPSDSLPFSKRDALIRHLLDLPENNPFQFRNKVLFLTMLKFGLTVGETLSMQKGDLHKNASRLLLTVSSRSGRTRSVSLLLANKETLPNGRERMVPITGNIIFCDVLKRYLASDKGLSWFSANRSTSYSGKGAMRAFTGLFLSRLGKTLSHDSVRELFTLLIKDLGWEKEGYTPKTLRHTAISYWLYSGLSLEEVSALAGHANIAVTERAVSSFKRKNVGSAVSLPF